MTRSRIRMEPMQNGDERGVSDVLAFMLVFATILGSVILLSTAGLQAMNDYQEFEQSQNAERAMTSLAANFDDVLRYDGVTERYGEITLRGGKISTGSSGTNVSINISGTGTSQDHNIDLGTFTYESESGMIAYEGGGLVRDTENGDSILLERPALTCNTETDTALVSLVKIRSADKSIRSDGTLGITITRQSSGSYREVYDANEVTVTVDNSTTEYDQAWQSILNQGEWVNGTCSDMDNVAVTVVTVDIDY